jgi:HAE1 family hydrophobic/amphiphilic exporter-1
MAGSICGLSAALRPCWPAIGAGGGISPSVHHLAELVATLAATVVLYLVIPKVFSAARHGLYLWLGHRGQDSSSDAMHERMLALADIVRRDPDVTAFGMQAGASTFNSGNMFIGLRPLDEGRRVTADQVIARLRAQLAHIPGVTLYMQAGQDINVGGRLASAQYQYTLTDSNLQELNDWTPKSWRLYALCRA